MKKYVIALCLVLVAAMTVEICIPFAAACIGTALVLTARRCAHGKSSSTT